MKSVSILFAFSIVLLSVDYIKPNSIRWSLDQVINDPEYLSMNEYQQIKVLKALYNALGDSTENQKIPNPQNKVTSNSKFKMRPKNIFVG